MLFLRLIIAIFTRTCKEYSIKGGESKNEKALRSIAWNAGQRDISRFYSIYTSHTLRIKHPRVNPLIDLLRRCLSSDLKELYSNLPLPSLSGKNK